jgi:hypothetical protein
MTRGERDTKAFVELWLVDQTQFNRIQSEFDRQFEDCLRKRGIAAAHKRMVRQVAVACGRADELVAVCLLVDVVKSEAVDVHHATGALHTELH